MPLILFTSPKGGVGKTTLAAHVAARLAANGHEVLALDLDPQNALRLHLGLSVRETAGFFAHLHHAPPWQAVVRETPGGVRLLPYGESDPRQALELGVSLMQRPELLTGPVQEMLRTPGRVVVVDTPPGASAGVSALVPLADLAVVVLLADAGSASLLPQVASGQTYGRGTLAARMADRAAVVLNQVELDFPLSARVLDGAAQMLGPRLLGAVCRDDALGEALADRRLLTGPGCPAAEDLALLVNAVTERLKLRPPSQPAPSYAGLSEWGIAPCST